MHVCDRLHLDYGYAVEAVVRFVLQSVLGACELQTFGVKLKMFQDVA